MNEFFTSLLKKIITWYTFKRTVRTLIFRGLNLCNVMKNNLFFISQFTSVWNIFISIMKQIILSKHTRIYSWSQKYRSFWVVLHTYYYFIQNIQYGRIQYLWSTVRVNNIPRKKIKSKKKERKIGEKAEVVNQFVHS